jgi:hypothetical protein
VLHKALMIDALTAPEKRKKIDEVLDILTEKCNNRILNDDGQTPVFFATQERRKEYFWTHEVAQVVEYKTIATNNFKPSKSYELVAHLV